MFLKVEVNMSNNSGAIIEKKKQLVIFFRSFFWDLLDIDTFKTQKVVRSGQKERRTRLMLIKFVYILYHYTLSNDIIVT